MHCVCCDTTLFSQLECGRTLLLAVALMDLFAVHNCYIDALHKGLRC
jgi:hypothetical protein